MDIESHRFSTRQVCDVIGIPPGSLATWVQKGRLASFSATFGQQGKAATFSVNDVLALALLRQLNLFNADRPELDAFAPQIARLWRKAPDKVRDLIVSFWPVDLGHRVDIGFNDEAMSQPVPRGIFTITVSLEMIFPDLLRALEQVAAGAGNTPLVRRVVIHSPKGE